MHRFLLHNDGIRDAGDLIASPGQVGLLSGWGVFSTLRIYDGVLFAWDRHWARMQKDAALMRVPFPQDSRWLEQGLYRLIEANHAWNAVLRVVVVRNRGGIWQGPAATCEFDVVAFTSELVRWPDGVKLGIAPHARHAASEFAGTKYCSWAENLTRYERAHDQGLDEVILLNEHGAVSECTSANIFVVQGKHVWTPPLDAGCLPGVTRSVLLEQIHVPDLEVVERNFMPADLEAADGIFISSTTRELLPVIAIERRDVRRAGNSCERLRQAFRTYVDNYVARQRRPVTTT